MTTAPITYCVGTITLNNGNLNVFGISTAWDTGPITEGWFISFDGFVTWYQIASVSSATALILSTNYDGVNLSSQPYYAMSILPKYNLSIEVALPTVPNVIWNDGGALAIS